MANLTTAQIEAMNDWARTIPGLRGTFSYVSGDSDSLGMGDRLAATAAGSDEELATLDKEVDFVGATTIYTGWAQPGTSLSAASWRISRITFTGVDEDVSVVFAGGTSDFVNIWDDRASLDYSK